MVQLKPIKTWASPTYVCMALIFSLPEAQLLFVIPLAIDIWIAAIIAFPLAFLLKFLEYYLLAPAAFTVVTIDEKGLRYGKWNISWQQVKAREERAYVPVRRYIVNAPSIPLGLSLSLFGVKADYKSRSIGITIEKNSCVHEMFKRYCSNYDNISDRVCPSPPFTLGRGGLLWVILISLMSGIGFGVISYFMGAEIIGAIIIGLSSLLASLPWRIEKSLVSRDDEE